MKGTENLIGEVLDEKYRIERLLGQGGMGAVFFATHLGTERPVAVKVISPQFMQNEEFVERFKREARAAGRLRHPNVVDVTDFGFAHIGVERVAYLVMEYLDGCTLGDVLAEEKRLPLDWVVDIMEQVCSAVDEAHEQGIVHRDLKPDNIWLEPNRRGGYTIKVLDFGVAKLAGESESIAVQHAQLTSSSSSRASQVSSSSSIQSQNSRQRFDDDGGGTLLLPTTTQRPSASPVNTSSQRATSQQSEAATQLHTQPVINEEARTRILSLPHTDTVHDAVDAPAEVQEEHRSHEAATLLQPAINSQLHAGRTATPANGEGDQTRILNQRTERANVAVSTASNDEGLTRIGSLLGTPLYMSPEQCRGERLDARSDIYSLGIITYQMLAGETPFVGDLQTMMRLHKEVAPPSLRDKSKKIPKRIAQVVAGALAKKPDERPMSAAAFAGALRAYSEGADTLMRRASALYSEHFPTFLRISLIAHVPVILIVLLEVAFDVLRARHFFPYGVEIALVILGTLLAMLAQYFASAVISGVTVPLVIQLFVAPLRPLEIRPAFRILKKRLRPFLVTTTMVTLMSIIGFALAVIPGLILLIRYHLYAPVVLMEGLEKRAALRRARELMQRARRTVIIIILIEFAIPVIMSLIFARLTGGLRREGSNINMNISSRLSLLVNILIVPLLSILTAMVYLKVRQVGGESLKETLDQFEDENTTRSKWQTRMRERLSLHTRTTR